MWSPEIFELSPLPLHEQPPQTSKKDNEQSLDPNDPDPKVIDMQTLGQLLEMYVCLLSREGVCLRLCVSLGILDISRLTNVS